MSPEGRTDHRYHGISVFKRGFGGSDYEYLYARHLVIDYPRYALNLAAGKAMKHVRAGLAARTVGVGATGDGASNPWTGWGADRLRQLGSGLLPKRIVQPA